MARNMCQNYLYYSIYKNMLAYAKNRIIHMLKYRIIHMQKWNKHMVKSNHTLLCKNRIMHKQKSNYA